MQSDSKICLQSRTRPYMLNLGWYLGSYPNENDLAFHIAKEQHLWEDAPAKRVACSWQTPTGEHMGCKSMPGSHEIYRCWQTDFGKTPKIPWGRKMSPHGKSRAWFVLLPVKRGSHQSTYIPSQGGQAEPTRTCGRGQPCSQRWCLSRAHQPGSPHKGELYWILYISLMENTTK